MSPKFPDQLLLLKDVCCVLFPPSGIHSRCFPCSHQHRGEMTITTWLLNLQTHQWQYLSIRQKAQHDSCCTPAIHADLAFSICTLPDRKEMNDSPSHCLHSTAGFVYLSLQCSQSNNKLTSNTDFWIDWTRIHLLTIKICKSTEEHVWSSVFWVLNVQQSAPIFQHKLCGCNTQEYWDLHFLQVKMFTIQTVLSVLETSSLLTFIIVLWARLLLVTLVQRNYSNHLTYSEDLCLPQTGCMHSTDPHRHWQFLLLCFSLVSWSSWKCTGNGQTFLPGSANIISLCRH